MNFTTLQNYHEDLPTRRGQKTTISRMIEVVYKGSTASTLISDAVKKRNERLIYSLMQSGHINKLSNKLLRFEKDFIFNSPSAASDLITGNSTSGWVMWKTKQGKTLKDVEREKLKS